MKRLTIITGASLTFIAVLMPVQNIKAQDTWVGNTSVNWADSNWTGNNPPLTGDGLIFDVAGTAGTSLTDNLTTGAGTWAFTNLTFTANAPDYTITPGVGAGFKLGVGSPATVINQNSPNLETILDPITLGNTAQTISLGGGSLTLNDLISGSGGLTLEAASGSYVLTLTNAVGTNAYTGATVVNGGELDLAFPNLSLGGIYLSSSLTINTGGTVQANTDNALAGFGSPIGSLPVTINTGGTLTEKSTVSGSHTRGLLTLNGGTLAAAGAGTAAFGNWLLDAGIVVNGGANQSVISSPRVIPSQAGGTVFNVANGGTVSGIDLDVTGDFYNGTTSHDTGIIKTGNGTMALEGVNTYAGATTVSNGTLVINGTLGNGAYAGLITNYSTFIYNSFSAQTLSGVISGSGTLVQSNGLLTLSAASTYTGNTTIAGGTLYLTGAGTLASSNIVVGTGTTFDVSAVTFALGGNQSLKGSGTVNGSLSTAGKIYPGADGTAGILTFNNNLTLGFGATFNFDLNTTYNSANNDQVNISGILTNNLNVIHIKAPNTSSSLDTNADYVLITAGGGLFGSISGTPVWEVAPLNSTNFVVLVSGNNVVLHYIASGVPAPPSGGAAANPSTLTRNQSTIVSVMVTNGTFPISTVVLNASAIGGSTSVSMVRSNLSNVYTNTVTVAPGTSLGSPILAAVITDNQGNSSQPITVSLTIAAAGQVWNGAGANDNWSTNPNWVGGLAPGYAGDSVTFAGTARLTPNVDTNYSITGLTFNNTAGSFNIGTANGSALTLAGGVTNNSTSAETLNVPTTLSAAATLNAASGALVIGQNLTNGANLLTIAATNNVAISGAIIGTTAGGLTKNASLGTLTLSGANTYGGATTISGGTLAVSGSGALTPAGNGAGSSRILIGNVSGVPAGLNQSGGTITTSAGGGGNMQIGGAVGASGYYNLSGGTLMISNTTGNGAEINVGGTSGGAGTFAQFDMSSGTVAVGVVGNTKAYFQAPRGVAGEFAVVNLSGGSLIVNTNITDDNGGGYSANWATSGSTTNVTTISGTATLLSPTVSIKLNQRNNAGQPHVGILNLNGGLVQAFGFYAAGNLNAVINFNGGMLMAGFTNSAESFTNALNFLGNVGSVYDYSGGAFINDNGYAITIRQPIWTPTGNGVTAIPVATAGAGYVMPPAVMITGGGGSGATAYATISGGQVTGIAITCPGNSYTAAPTVALVGGGATAAATLGTVTIGANASGGLTKSGTGTLFLAGANTYTGVTTVSNGTLSVSAAQPNTAPVVVKDGAVLNVVASGSSHFSPSLLTVGNNMGAGLGFVVSSTTQALLTPAAFSHTGNYTINILAGSLVVGSSYPLLTLGSTPSGFTLGTLPVGVSANLFTTGNTLYLNVTAMTNTLWTGSVNGTWDIATTLNWTNTGVASTYSDGSLVKFDDTAACFLITNSVATTVSPSDILVSNVVNNYNISNNLVIAGLGGLTKNGSGTLTIGPGAVNAPYIYAGPTTVNGGTLNLNFGNFGNSGIYNSGGLIINTNATVVDMIDNGLCGSASPLGSLPVTINAGGLLTGLGTADAGAGTSTHIRGLLTLNGGTLANGGTGAQATFGTWDLDNGVLVNGGPITSTISAINVEASQPGGTVFNVANGGTPSGIDLNVPGFFIVAGQTGIIKTGNGTMALTGTNTFTTFMTISNGTMLLNGNGRLASGIYGGAITNLGTFVDSSTQPQILMGVVSGTGVLQVNSASSLLVLSNANTYTGSTLISAGMLALTNNGSIAASTNIQVSFGATLDVSKATTPALPLATGQTLTGAGVIKGSVTNFAGATIAPGGPSTAGTLTVTNIASLGGGNTLMVLNSGGSSSKLVATNINYGGTLTLNNVGPAYAGGNSFTIFSAVNYTGTFTNIVPATPGAGLAWNTNNLTTSGVLSVITVSSPISALRFTASPMISGTTLTVAATNTGAGNVYLLSSTNVAAARNTWLPIWTNVLGGSSSFTTNLLNAVNPAYSQNFYILSTTNNH